MTGEQAYNIPVKVRTADKTVMAGLATITKGEGVNITIQGKPELIEELFDMAEKGLLWGFTVSINLQPASPAT